MVFKVYILIFCYGKDKIIVLYVELGIRLIYSYSELSIRSDSIYGYQKVR